MLQVALSAKSMGFGSASKAVTIAEMLTRHKTNFIGEGLAFDYARAHDAAFDTLTECSPGNTDCIIDSVQRADCAFVVRDPEVTYWAVKLQRPTVVFDSLLSFWLPSRPLRDLAAVTERIRTAPPDVGWQLLRTLPPHDAALAAHLLAWRSFAQRMPGVSERVQEIRALGYNHLSVCGPIINESRLADFSAEAFEQVDNRDYRLLVNLGGFKNFYLDFEDNNAYLRLIERWVVEFLDRHDACRSILVCCGAYSTAREVRVKDRIATFCMLDRDELLRQVARTPLYLCAPGITSIEEAILLRRLPMLLPEEHYGHVFAHRAFSNTKMGRLGIRLVDGIIPSEPIPDHDFEGTRAIASLAARIIDSAPLYIHFRDAMDGAVNRFRNLSPDIRKDAVQEVLHLLDGPGLDTVLRVTCEETERLLAHRGSAEVQLGTQA